MKTIYVYLKEMVKICQRFNIPIVWITPSGLKIKQKYTLSKAQKVSISFDKKSISVVLRTGTDKLDKSKQIQAVIPNIIHSLDASHLINILNTGLNSTLSHIITVHDCFGTHPNEVGDLKKLVILEFIKLYTDTDFLNLFHERLLQSFTDNQVEVHTDENGKKYLKPNRIKIYLPEIPPKGELDLLKIKESQYIIN